MTRTDWTLLLTLSVLWGGSFLFVEMALHGPARADHRAGQGGDGGADPGRGAWPCAGLALPRRAWGAVLVMGFLNNAIPFTLFVLAQGQHRRGAGRHRQRHDATVDGDRGASLHHGRADHPAQGRRRWCFGFAGVVVMAGGAGGGERLAILCLSGGRTVLRLCRGLGAALPPDGRAAAGHGLRHGRLVQPAAAAAWC